MAPYLHVLIVLPPQYMLTSLENYYFFHLFQLASVYVTTHSYRPLAHPSV